MTAKERLEENGRLCDNCLGPLPRFTNRCAFDEKVSEVYGSTCGCAKAYYASAKCSGCGARLNPFKGQHQNLGDKVICATCINEGDVSLPPGYEDIHEVVVATFPKRVQEALASGPYKVVKKTGDAWYQIILPTTGKPSVRAAKSSLGRAIELCVSFNESPDQKLDFLKVS